MFARDRREQGLHLLHPPMVLHHHRSKTCHSCHQTPHHLLLPRLRAQGQRCRQGMHRYHRMEPNPTVHPWPLCLDRLRLTPGRRYFLSDLPRRSAQLWCQFYQASKGSPADGHCSVFHCPTDVSTVAAPRSIGRVASTHKPIFHLVDLFEW